MRQEWQSRPAAGAAWRRVALGMAAAMVVAMARPAAAQTPAESATAPRLTLEEVVARAIRHDPSVVASAGAVRAARSGERLAWGAYLPSLSLNSTASQTSTERFNPQTNTAVTGASRNLNAGVSSGVELYDGGRRGAERRSALATTTAAEGALDEQRFGAALAATRAFYEVLRAEELERTSALRVTRAESGRQAAERRLQAGSATRSDALRGRLEEADAGVALARAEAARRTAMLALGRLVGEEGAVGAEATSAPIPRPLALDRVALVSLAAENPVVRSAAARVLASAAGIGAARAQNFPSLRLTGDTNWFNDELALDGGRDSWTARLGLTYPLFNGFQREDAITRARIQETSARAELADARRLAVAEAERLLALLALAEREVELATQAVAVTVEDLQVQEERYRVGASTSLDRITSQVSLAESEEALVNARYDYEIARAELEALVGRPL